jgi:diguanylate cyclase (GGDEF)-like protein
MNLQDVIIVSPDRSWLRRLSLLVEEYGYQSTACADFDGAAAALDLAPADFLLIDEAALEGQWRTLSQLKQGQSRHLHVLLFHHENAKLDQLSALEAGVDDFLKLPLSAGEVLARLRAGLRSREFERRWGQGEWTDAATGLWTRAALLGRLEQEFAKPDRARRCALVALAVDRLVRLQNSFGQTGANRILQAITRLLDEARTPASFAVHLGDGRFALLLPDHTAEKGLKLSESLRASAGEIEIPELTGDMRLSLSGGVAVCEGKDDSPESLLDRAEQLLRDAQRSGGDLCLAAGHCDEERRQWLDNLRSGHPFESAAAREVMTPFTLSLRVSDTIAYAGALFAQTQLDVLPVIDFSNRFVGIVECEQIREALATAGRSGQPLEPIAQRDVPQVPDAASFATVIDQFIKHDRSLLVVTKRSRPLGYIVRERFLNLVKPIQPDLFAPAADPLAGSGYLVVAEALDAEN